VFVFLEGSKDKISDRLASRHGHFMPPALLESQFEALEPPAEDENFIALCVSATPADEAQEIIDRLNLGPGDTARPSDPTSNHREDTF
jgi:gluconokinase/shikimate kinase